ncbi:acyl-CoA dehydrogenase [Oleiphilus messinensis]|uniref:Acyl-CoA dehydrogenase n=2 Tax=Oleiphilus messinensis TaxID=141451 RepID=A0A1Y0I9Z5_9GAMM|nr:acyl-CoA dehydrogenase [Oleiphilus messinensis]
MDAVQSILNRAFSYLKQQTKGPDGRLSATRLDDYQLVSYDLAFCAAEVRAARSMLQVAEGRLNDEHFPFEERTAVLFCAEIIENIRARIQPRYREYGLTRELLAETLETQSVLEFCESELSTLRYVELGGMVLSQTAHYGEPELDEDKAIMRETFRDFATEIVQPLSESIHREDLIVPDEILQPLTEMGCFGLSIPEQYGGLQPDTREDNMGMIVVTEELSRGSLAAAGSLITRPEILSRALLAGGTEDQKKSWLPKLASGETLCAVAITEPDYGSDVAGMKLRAEKVEGGWILNGAKTWCTFAGKASVLLTLARTNPDRTLGHKGLSMFLVEKPGSDGHEFQHQQNRGGMITGKAITTIGYRGMHSYDVFFDQYFVPDCNLLGEEAGLGKGFYYTMAGFAGGRIQTAARANGVMKAALEQALRYARERKVFGAPIGEYQLSMVKLARMVTLLRASRLFTYAVGGLMDRGEGQMEASLVKLFACKTSEWLCREAMQIHGGMGYAEESAVSRYWIDSRVLSIFEGAEETLALKVIARSLIENARE